MFRIYEGQVIFNEKHFDEVWIDPHYEEKHGDSVNDELILRLLGRLGGKFYRLILVVPPDASYLGVRNVYRRRSP